MRGKICIRAAMVAAILCAGPSDPFPSLFGIGPADAKDYYTRKRVNGRWVTGRFPKRSAAAADAPAAPARDTAPESGPAPAHLSATRPQDAPEPAADSQVQEQSRLLPLQRALEERARSMAARESRIGPHVRSVTYDFDKRRKTVRFLDGTSTEEPLEPIATGQTDFRR